MAQHFLLSAAARTLSLKTIFSEGEDAAYRRFRRLRWPETDGAPVCPVCGCLDIYDLTTRRRFKCAACHHQFSVTSGTILASRKLSFVDLLGAICLFVNASKGLSAVQLSRAANGRADARLLERSGPAGPSDRAGSGGEDRALVKAMVGLQAGKKPRQIAEDIYGADEVKANWYPDSGMRSQVRRRIDKARALADGGWRDLVPRHGSER